MKNVIGDKLMIQFIDESAIILGGLIRARGESLKGTPLIFDKGYST